MKIRFVVVDDAAFLRELIKNTVVSLGATCVGEADNGEDAISLVDKSLPDLVFLDMVMPLRNGVDAASEIKERHPEVKIIGCSTVDDESFIQKALAAGVDAYVVKPFSKEQIADEIQKVFSQSGEVSHGRI